MKIAGIIAEYNPFHLGHAHHIEETRRILGADCTIVCVMSGDFVQRGEPAVFSKYARAEAAVRCGADLVVELPLPWCMSTAERFANGAVSLLGGLGVVDHISFGSESGDAAKLLEISACLDSAQYSAQLRRYLDEGLPFAVCRQKAVEDLLGAQYGTVLSSPNDNLAVEYLRAVRAGGYAMEPLAVRRIGAGHDAMTGGGVRSGSQLRQMFANREDTAPYLPQAAYQVFQAEIEQGRGPVTLSSLEPLILSRLRMLEERDFSVLPDAGEGLEHKLCSACGEQPSLTAIYDSVKSKRYSHARIRRMTMSAALGVRKEHLFERPPYARILAFNDNGAEILHMAKARSSLPILSKPTAVKLLNTSANEVFALTAKAHDLYVLAYQNAGFHAGGQDWRESPRYIC